MIHGGDILTYSELQLVAKTEYYHVNNVKLLEYLDQARKVWYQFCLSLNVEAVIVHISADYKKEVFHNDHLSIRTSIHHIGHTSFTLNQIMLDNKTEELVIETTVVLTTIDRQSREKVRVPDELRDLLNKDLILNDHLT